MTSSDLQLRWLVRSGRLILIRNDVAALSSASTMVKGAPHLPDSLAGDCR
jgi:hypothetical protein